MEEEKKVKMQFGRYITSLKAKKDGIEILKTLFDDIDNIEPNKANLEKLKKTFAEKGWHLSRQSDGKVKLTKAKLSKLSETAKKQIEAIEASKQKEIEEIVALDKDLKTLTEISNRIGKEQFLKLVNRIFPNEQYNKTTYKIRQSFLFYNNEISIANKILDKVVKI